MMYHELNDIERNIYLKELLSFAATERSRNILKMYYGLNGGRMNAIEISKEFNISPCRVYQIINAALRRIKHKARKLGAWNGLLSIHS